MSVIKFNVITELRKLSQGKATLVGARTLAHCALSLIAAAEAAEPGVARDDFFEQLYRLRDPRDSRA
jgi:hypothetical protein